MNRNLYNTSAFIILLLLLFLKPLNAQNIVYLNPVEDAVTTSQFPTTNWGGHPQLSAYAWTQGGQFSLHRSYLKYDYQHLSLGRPLIRATLHLKYYDPIGYPHSGLNHMRIGLCDTNWSEYQINWLNQPSPVPDFHVDIPMSSGQTDISLDILPLVLFQFHNGNNGLVLNLTEESIYRMVVFGSRENEGYVPQLELEFLDINTRCDTFSDPGTLDIVQINSSTPLFGNINPLQITISSSPTQNFNTNRVLFRPDLTRLPSSINILYANLSLRVFNTQQLPNAGNTALSLFPLNQYIPTNSFNWSNQPSHTTQVVARSLAPKSNFGMVHLDIKPLLERSLSLGQFHGYLLRQSNESIPGVSYFAGTGFLAGPARPTLLVCYTTNTSSSNTNLPTNLQVYPNPTRDEVQVSFEVTTNNPLTLRLHDMQGRLIYQQVLSDPLNGYVQMKLSTATFNNGVYTLSLQHGVQFSNQKLVVAH